MPLVIEQQIPDILAVVPYLAYDLLGFGRRYPGIVGALQHKQRRGDLIDIVDRGGSVEVLRNIRLAFYAESLEIPVDQVDRGAHAHHESCGVRGRQSPELGNQVVLRLGGDEVGITR